MIAILTTAIFFSAAVMAFAVLGHDGAKLLRSYGEMEAQLQRIDRDALCDPAAFRLRPAADVTRGVPVRSAQAPRFGVAA